MNLIKILNKNNFKNNLLQTSVFHTRQYSVPYISNYTKVMFYYQLKTYKEILLNLKSSYILNLVLKLIQNSIYLINTLKCTQKKNLDTNILNEYQKFLYKKYTLNQVKIESDIKYSFVPNYKVTPKDLIKHILQIKRVSATNKKGRITRFSVLMVIGTGSGWVGIGKAKSFDILQATKQAYMVCCKNIKYLTKTNTHTLIKEYSTVYKQCSIYLKPLSFHSGLICSKPIKYILKAAGYLNVWCTIVKGSKNIELISRLLISTLQVPIKKELDTNYINQRSTINLFSF